MENIIKQLKNGAKHTYLTSLEKAEMKGVLLRHIKAHPVSNGALFGRSVPSPFSINNFRNKKGLSALVIGGLLMSGTVSFAAENTVPGDILYPVKVSVNERVRGAVAVTPKAKADWDVRLVERRLQEVERLAVNQEARPEVRRLADDNLEHYTERVKARIAKFEEDEDSADAIETVSNLSMMLATHEQVLAGLEEDSETVATTTMAVNIQTKDEKSATDTLRKVRGARDDADKKHKELKKKYFKEEKNGLDVNAVMITPLPPATASVLLGDHEEAVRARIRRVREEKKDKEEEIHGTTLSEIVFVPTVATSTPSVGAPIVEEAVEHKESEKSEDND